MVIPRHCSIHYSENGESVVTEACFVICYLVRFLIDMVNGIEQLYASLGKHPYNGYGIIQSFSLKIT